jgi:hypothetical protein
VITQSSKPLIGKQALTVAPTVEPVAASDAAPHINYPSHQETRVTAFLTTARQLAEAWCGIAFTTQTRTLTFDLAGLSPLDDFWYQDSPRAYGKSALYLPRVIDIPGPPLLTVSSIQYYLDDDTDVASTFASTNYYVSKPAPTVGTAPEPGKTALRTGKVWPTGLRPIDSLVITYTCGYGATAASVPTTIKEAIIEWAAHMYENREGQQAANAGGAVVLNRGAFVPAGVQTKLMPFRLVRA